MAEGIRDLSPRFFFAMAVHTNHTRERNTHSLKQIMAMEIPMAIEARMHYHRTSLFEWQGQQMANRKSQMADLPPRLFGQLLDDQLRDHGGQGA